jgi:glycine oxidase
MSAPDVVIVGGGVVGLSIAWRSAQRGLAVSVVDSAPGRGASWVAAGMLAPVTEVHYGEERLLRLNLAAARGYPDFVAELEEAAGAPVGYRRCGTLVVARDSDENAELDELFGFQQSLDLEVERLRSRECRVLEPGLSPRIRGGILVAGDHQVDSRALVDALLRACAKEGVEFVPERVEEVVAAPRVEGVRLSSGRVAPAGHVVLAAGTWSGNLGLDGEVLPSVRPVKGQLVHLAGPVEAAPASRTVRGLTVYLVPRADGRVVVGATMEERGYDDSVTAGGVYELLRDAAELVPGVLELELTETIAGLRPATPDNAPLIGPAALEGLVVATGHYRNGILLAPVTADAVSSYLESGELPASVSGFSPSRFSAAVSG